MHCAIKRSTARWILMCSACQRRRLSSCSLAYSFLLTFDSKQNVYCLLFVCVCVFMCCLTWNWKLTQCSFLISFYCLHFDGYEHTCIHLFVHTSFISVHTYAYTSIYVCIFKHFSHKYSIPRINSSAALLQVFFHVFCNSHDYKNDCQAKQNKTTTKGGEWNSENILETCHLRMSKSYWRYDASLLQWPLRLHCHIDDDDKS